MIKSLIREQYGRSIDLLERGRLTEGVIIPSERECIELLSEQYTNAQITHIQEKIRRPVFQIVPQKPFTDFESAINLNGRWEVIIKPYLQERFAKMPSSNEVQIGFIEGKIKPPGISRELFTIQKQAELYKKTLPTGVTVIHPRNYALLQLDGKVDVTYGHKSPLEDNSNDSDDVPCGYYNVEWVGFDAWPSDSGPASGSSGLTWRASVMLTVNYN